MSTASDNTLLRELKTDAQKWIIKTFPSRLGNGIDEVEVRIQMKAEADAWVEYNYEQRRQGKEGTASPDVKA